MNIYVESEFAPLKRVVLTESEFIFPQKIMNVDFLPEESIKDSKRVAGMSYQDAYPELYEKWILERANLKAVLEKYGVEVLIPRKLTEFEKNLGGSDGCSNFFARDPFFVIGNAIIEGSLRFPHRRNEILPIRDILIAEANKNEEAIYVSVPRADISKGLDSEDGPFLEGGDILVYGKTVFVGNSGLASNLNGQTWLKNYIRHFGYNVEFVSMNQDVLHLDCAISLVREGLMIVCEDALSDGIPKILSEWDKIVVEKKEVECLAVNGLSVNEEVYITDPKMEQIGKELEKRGITVEYIDFSISRSLGGSFRCSTQPLLRMHDEEETRSEM